MKINQILQRLRAIFRFLLKLEAYHDQHLMLISAPLADLVKKSNSIDSLADVEFKVFSQWGDDGIIQWLINHIDIDSETFIEFGVEDYQEANTRFLLMNNNWSGLVMDGSKKNVARITNSEYYWKYDLSAIAAFIDRDNITGLIEAQGFPKEVGLLHIDLDGNDYWIWEKIENISPAIVIMEYNSVFGAERAITIPYSKTFQRTKAHHSNLYFGASLGHSANWQRKKAMPLLGVIVPVIMPSLSGETNSMRMSAR